MRTQYCREHIDVTAAECGLEAEAVRRVKVVTEFVDKHPLMRDCSSRAITALITEKDGEARDIAILLAENALRARTPSGGVITKAIDEKGFRGFIKRAKLQIKTENQKALEEERQKAEDLKAKAEAKVAVTKVEDPVFLELKRLSEDLEDLTAQCAINKKRLAIAEETIDIRIDELKEAEQKVKDAKAHRDGIQREVDIDEKNIAQYVEQMNKLKDGV